MRDGTDYLTYLCINDPLEGRVPLSVDAPDELLIFHVERPTRWRHHHPEMTGRQIGRRRDTDASEGTAYHHTRLSGRRRFVMWEVRSEP